MSTDDEDLYGQRADQLADRADRRMLPFPKPSATPEPAASEGAVEAATKLREHSAEFLTGASDDSYHIKAWAEIIERLAVQPVQEVLALAENGRLALLDALATAEAQIKAHSTTIVRLGQALTAAESERDEAIDVRDAAVDTCGEMAADRDGWKEIAESAVRERDEQKARAEGAEEVLRGVEWVVAPGKLDFARCPACKSQNANGHRRSCELSAALEASKPPATSTPAR